MTSSWYPYRLHRASAPPPPESAILYTAAQVADACQVSVPTVRAWIKTGKVAAVILPSGQRRITRAELERLVSSR